MMYRVYRSPESGVVLEKADINGSEEIFDAAWEGIPPPRLHSPTGFEYGYGGSGPADLALAILLDHYGETVTQAKMGSSRAWLGHQRLKREWVAGLGPNAHVFYITSGAIDDILGATARPATPSALRFGQTTEEGPA